MHGHGRRNKPSNAQNSDKRKTTAYLDETADNTSRLQTWTRLDFERLTAGMRVGAVTDFVGPCQKGITICTTTMQSKRRQGEGVRGRERTWLICVSPPVLSRLSKMFMSPFMIELRACQLQSTHFQIVHRRSQRRLPRRILASGWPRPLGMH